MKKRAEVTYWGRVHGVGFRFTAERLAPKYHLTGYVMNAPDNKVELVVEGEEEEAKNFLDELYLEMKGNIDRFNADWFDASGRFKGFNIRFY